jgi:prevent-host-death family protein
MTAGIRELKDNLSEYVRRVEGGERVAVTAHGRVVAMLVPADDAARGRRPSRLEQMIADGTAGRRSRTVIRWQVAAIEDLSAEGYGRRTHRRRP